MKLKNTNIKYALYGVVACFMLMFFTYILFSAKYATIHVEGEIQHNFDKPDQHATLVLSSNRSLLVKYNETSGDCHTQYLFTKNKGIQSLPFKINCNSPISRRKHYLHLVTAEDEVLTVVLDKKKGLFSFHENYTVNINTALPLRDRLK